MPTCVLEKFQWECFLFSVTAIRCYECSSSDNKYCNDPPDTGSLQPVDCGNGGVCTKEILTVFDKTVVSRWCGDANFCKNVDESIATCSLCLTDLCNSSSFLKNSQALLLLSAFLASIAVVRRIFAV